MARITFRIPLRFRSLLFSFLAGSWLSGITFFVLNKWFIIEGEFGPEKHPWQYPALMIHGGFAFLMMISYGALLVSHVPSAWKLNRSRYLGLSLITVLGFQVVTAYMLYYLGNEELRGIVANLHSANGFFIPFLLASHILIGINKRGGKVNSVE